MNVDRYRIDFAQAFLISDICSFIPPFPRNFPSTVCNFPNAVRAIKTKISEAALIHWPRKLTEATRS